LKTVKTVSLRAAVAAWSVPLRYKLIAKQTIAIITTDVSMPVEGDEEGVVFITCLPKVMGW